MVGGTFSQTLSARRDFGWLEQPIADEQGYSSEDRRRDAERIRVLIGQTRFSSQGIDYGPITISMGICMAAEAESADDLYARADRALYRSKLNGRNRVTKFAPTQDHPLKSWLLYRKD